MLPKGLVDHYIDQILIYEGLCRNAYSRKDMLRYAQYKEILDELKEKSGLKRISSVSKS